MCFAKTPKMPEAKPPAPPPPPPEESAANEQGAPVVESLDKKSGKSKKNKLRIDLKDPAITSQNRFSIYSNRSF